MSVISKCVFQALDFVSKKYPDLSKKDQLDISYSWCSKRVEEKKVGKDFVCSEFWDFVDTRGTLLDDIQMEIDFLETLLVPVDDFISQDVFGREKKQAQTLPARKGKQERAAKKKVGVAKRTPEAQTILKHPKLGESVFEVKDPEHWIKVGQELLPLPTLTSGPQTIRGKPTMTARPMTPVTSSMVQGRAVRGNRLYIKFHSSPDKVYKYTFPSQDAAMEAFNDITSGSPGGWVWDNLRGKQMGPVFGKPNKMTRGGTSASLVPYDKMSYSRVQKVLGEIPEFEELAEKWKTYKMGVKAEGEGATSREPYTTEEIKKFQAKLKGQIADRRKTMEELREMFKKKGLKELKFDLVKYRFDQLDVWIDKGHKNEFLSKLLEQDIKLYETKVVSTQQDAKRYSIDIRAFSKYEIPKGNNWQVNNVFRGKGELGSKGKELPILKTKEGKHSKLTKKISELKETKKNIEERLPELDIDNKTKVNKRIYQIDQEIKGLEKKETKLYYEIENLKEYQKSGKGKGWWGDPEGHSIAAKKGKKSDLTKLEGLEGLVLKLGNKKQLGLLRVEEVVKC